MRVNAVAQVLEVAPRPVEAPGADAPEPLPFAQALDRAESDGRRAPAETDDRPCLPSSECGEQAEPDVTADADDQAIADDTAGQATAEQADAPPDEAVDADEPVEEEASEDTQQKDIATPLAQVLTVEQFKPAEAAVQVAAAQVSSESVQAAVKPQALQASPKQVTAGIDAAKSGTAPSPQISTTGPAAPSPVQAAPTADAAQGETSDESGGFEKTFTPSSNKPETAAKTAPGQAGIAPGPAESTGAAGAAPAPVREAEPVQHVAPAPLPEPLPEDADANVGRVIRGMHSVARQEGGAITLHLTPPELGVVRIQMEVARGVVTAHFQTEYESVRDLLTNQMGQLRHALESQGLSIDRLTVQTAQPGAPQQGTSDQSGDDGRSRGQFARQQPDQNRREQPGQDARERIARFAERLKLNMVA